MVKLIVNSVILGVFPVQVPLIIVLCAKQGWEGILITLVPVHRGIIKKAKILTVVPVIIGVNPVLLLVLIAIHVNLVQEGP